MESSRGPGALTVTLVDLEEIRAVALRQRGGKFYEELSVVGAPGALQGRRGYHKLLFTAPAKAPPVYIRALHA